jgi:serine/threonine kinase 32
MCPSFSFATMATANTWQNVASDIIQGKVLTSKSGTLAYLAPEVYAGQGYDVRADWWSLGVLFYECIYNKVSVLGNGACSGLSTHGRR